MDELDLGATIKGFTPGQTVFSRYTLTRILGRGGMGVVWLARDDKLERDVALKFLPEVMMGDKLALADLKRETRRSLDLTHSHIVRIYDFVEDGRTAAIAMEYIAGETLTNARVDRPGHCYEPADIAPWVAQLCAALDYAHTKAKVVHRDLKPANLMIDAAGDLKVTDFGIATSIADSVSRVSKQAGSSGTPVYMSPQQMMGDKPAVTDDIYALGATLYDLLTGKPPFYSGNIILQVQSKVPPSLADRRAELNVQNAAMPPAWEETIAACLAKEPKDRPQSAGEVAERLGLGAKGNAQRPTSNAHRSDGGSEVEQLDPKTLPSTKDNALGSTRSTSKAPLYAGLAAGVVLLAGLGWYLGAYLPEQKRLAEAKAAEEKRVAEIARLENEKKIEEANRLKLEQERTAAAERARKEQERLAAERLAAARGGIVIRTNPAGAEVRVGAAALDKSPLTLKDQKLGKYPVRVRLKGYEDWTGEVEVRENDFAELDVVLIPIPSAPGPGAVARIGPILSKMVRDQNLTRDAIANYAQDIANLAPPGLVGSEAVRPILDEVAADQNVTRESIGRYGERIAAEMGREVSAYALRLAREDLGYTKEVLALYLSSFKDQGLITRLLALPADVVRDAANLSIVSTKDRRVIEDRLVLRAGTQLRERNAIWSDPCIKELAVESRGIAEDALSLSQRTLGLYLSTFADQEIALRRYPSMPPTVLEESARLRGANSSVRKGAEEQLIADFLKLNARLK